MDKFTESYIECMLWICEDEHGVPLEDNYFIGDIDSESLDKIVDECHSFLESNVNLIEQIKPIRLNLSGMQVKIIGAYEQAGHDFYLARNGHGSGFLDRNNIPEDVREALTEAAESYSNSGLLCADSNELQYYS